MFDAIVAGHLCLDLFPDLSDCTASRLEEILQPGRLTVVGPVGCCTGGAVSNTGLALTRLGIRTGLMGKVGDDLFGQAVVEYIRGKSGEGAGALVVDPAAHTSFTIVLSLPGVDRIFLHHPGANDSFGAGDVRYDLVAGARLFHFGYPPLMRRMYQDGGMELTRALRLARETGATTSLDMALPDPASPAGQVDWREILRRALPHVDLFLPSLEEVLFMGWPELYRALRDQAGGREIPDVIPPETLSELGRELVKWGAGVVGIKLGARGLYLRTADRDRLEAMGRARPADPEGWAGRELWAPCFRVEVAGTTGSGDATIAGLLAALLRGLSPEEAVTAAVAVGACNVEAADALSGIRTWEETWQRVRGGWPRRELAVDAPGWHWEPVHALHLSRYPDGGTQQSPKKHDRQAKED